MVLCLAVSEAFAWNTLAHILMGLDAIFSLYSTRNGPLDELVHQNFRISLWACPPTPCSSALCHQSPTLKAHLNIMKPVSHCLYQKGFGQENLLFPFKQTGQQCHGLHVNMDYLLGLCWCAALRSFYFLFTTSTVELNTFLFCT